MATIEELETQVLELTDKNKELEAKCAEINAQNEEIYNLDELFYDLHKKIIPVFNISNINIAKKLVPYLQKKAIAIKQNIFI